MKNIRKTPRHLSRFRAEYTHIEETSVVEHMRKTVHPIGCKECTRSMQIYVEFYLSREMQKIKFIIEDFSPAFRGAKRRSETFVLIFCALVPRRRAIRPWGSLYVYTYK